MNEYDLPDEMFEGEDPLSYGWRKVSLEDSLVLDFSNYEGLLDEDVQAPTYGAPVEQEPVVKKDPLYDADLAIEIRREMLRREARRTVDSLEIVHDSEYASRFMDGGTYVYDIPDGVPAIWGAGTEVLWAVGESLIIAGPPGVGKSTLTMQLVQSIVMGGEVLGLPTATLAPGEKLLYLACDRAAQIRRLTSRLMRGQDRQMLAERMVFWQGPPPGDFTKQPDLLLDMCKAAGAKYVVIDSLKDVVSNLNSDESGLALNSAMQSTIQAGIGVMALHHVRKSGGENGEPPNKLSDLYGSAFITAGTGSVILLWGEAGDTSVDFKHLKQPASMVGPMRITHDHETGISSLPGEDQIERVWCLPGELLAIGEIAKRFFNTDDPTEAQKTAIRRKVATALDKGSIACTVDTGHMKLYVLV